MMDRWLSDSFRGIKVLVLVVSLLGICGLYGWRATQRPVGWSKCMADPSASDGQRVVLSLYRVDGVDSEGLLRVSKVSADVPVDLTALEDSRAPEAGQRVSVVGRFRAEDRVLVAESIEVHLLRWAKEALGLVGVGLVVVLLPVGFRWRDGALEDRWPIW